MKKRFLCILLICLLLSASLPAYAFAGTDGAGGTDFYLVLDASHSMAQNDPKKHTIEAAKLLVSLLDAQKDRFGYVYVSDKVQSSSPLQSLAEEKSAEKLCAALDKLKPGSAVQTDISLGLLTALTDLVLAGSPGKDRKAAVIVIGDGAEGKLAAQREELAKKELQSTLEGLAGNGIPVYTIALTESGREPMKELLQKSSGRGFEAAAGAEILPCIADIFAEMKQAQTARSTLQSDAKEPVVFSAELTHDGAACCSLILYTDAAIKDLQLTDPDGNEAAMNEDAVLYKSLKGCAVLRIPSPARGSWKLSCKTGAKTAVTMQQLLQYDMGIRLLSDSAHIVCGDFAEFTLHSANVADSAGIFAGAEAVLTLQSSSGETLFFDMVCNGDTMRASITPEPPGTYSCSAVLTGPGGSFRQQSDSVLLTVQPFQMDLKDDSPKSVLLFTRIAGFGSRAKKSIEVTDFIVCEPSAELQVCISDGKWQQLCSVSYDTDGELLTIDAGRSGSASLPLAFSDQYGGSAETVLQLYIVPTGLLAGFALIMLLIFVLICLAVKKQRRPFSKGRLRVLVQMPDKKRILTPPETDFDLSALHRQGSFAFADVYAFDYGRIAGSCGALYQNAMQQGVSKSFASSLQLEMRKNGKLRLRFADKSGFAPQQGSAKHALLGPGGTLLLCFDPQTKQYAFSSGPAESAGAVSASREIDEALHIVFLYEPQQGAEDESFGCMLDSVGFLRAGQPGKE